MCARCGNTAETACARPGFLGGFFVTAFVHRFLANQDGATAIEYALIAGGIALAIIATVIVLGEAVNQDFEAVENDWP
jgi:pilus assembly protein Flp/PilA